ncbi:ectoine/hydroxyectoine ABC transporter substrate-binding protein EhuB [Streptantibioticus ferralitis]|uniref:Ectoine/hydroxyectoine ABC transporter substrate-binding protein EhuB n=1 Tax=Streptantibioticus ferralitis TaxID=236510 RepID=A0ABT5YVA5_9ACTN|nr:ectoine/hydroxyectoine ABC transporter substrate-binding protein EhuB [Streptantibioticus ferralitis]MDF2255369.1 ectoine/hydroxyectoine ABC transporter substrate-binding protein EhuB [Streptantibioticus ferralitis]
MSYHDDPDHHETQALTRRGLLRGGAAFAALGLGAFAAAGCSRVPTADATDGGNLLDRLRKQGTVRVGIAGEIPYAYIDKNGRLTGEAPTVAKTIFSRLGVPHTQPVPIDFGSLIPGLRSNQFDVIAAGMFINPTRCQQVLFSDPDYQVQEALIVPKGNPKKLRSYADIARSGASMGVATGGIEIQYAKSYGVPGGKVDIYNDQLSGLEGIEAGRMDCFAGTSLTLRNLLATGHHPKVELTEPFIPVVGGKKQYGAGGYGFRPGETRLRDAFNSELHKMRSSGELLRLIRPFGFTETESTTLTAKELCG